jgi:prepilin-type N-terminal cleavage/methylation domain-containing protein
MRKGFTLIEILIAVGIFSIIVLLTTGAFLGLSSVQKNLQGSQEVLNELRFAIDLMGQEIIYGSAFVNELDQNDKCKNGCDLQSPGQQVIFASRVRPDVPIRRIHYYLTNDPLTGNGIIMKGEQKTHGPCSVIGGTWGGSLMPECYQPFTSDKIDIKLVKFFVNNNEDSGEQPIINVIMQGTILPGTKNEEEFKISTSFTPRSQQDPTQLPPTDNQPPTVIITHILDPGLLPAINPHTTNNTSLALRGTAEDNRGIQKITWVNQTTTDTGTMSSIIPSLILTNNWVVHTWITNSIPLKRSSLNTITVTAEDTSKITSSDTIDIICNAPLVPPNFWQTAKSCSCGNPRVRLDWDQVPGADSYKVYRCLGGACIPNSLVYTASPGDNTKWEYDYNVIPGNTYSYCVTAVSNFGGGTESSCSGILSQFVSGCTQPQCKDHLDNEGDGFCDYNTGGAFCSDGSILGDPECSNACDETEDVVPPGPPPQCNDGLDNEPVPDGFIDYPSDCGCTNASDNTENIWDPGLACQDGVDNDGDHLIDLNDPDCSSKCDNDESSAPPPPPPTPYFTLSAFPTIKSICVDPNKNGDVITAPYGITVNPFNGFNSPVTLSLSGGPFSGYNFSPNPVAANGTSYLRISVPNSTPKMNYSYTVSGSGGGTSDTVNIALEVLLSSDPPCVGGGL